MPRRQSYGAALPTNGEFLTKLNLLSFISVAYPRAIEVSGVRGNTVIDFMDPATALWVANNENVNKMAQYAREDLNAAIAGLEHS